MKLTLKLILKLKLKLFTCKHTFYYFGPLWTLFFFLIVGEYVKYFFAIKRMEVGSIKEESVYIGKRISRLAYGTC